MKKGLLIISIVSSYIVLQAQPGTISLNLDPGYTFQSRVDFNAAYTEVQGAFQYGGGIEYFTGYNQSFDLKYLRMDTHMPLFKPNGEQYNTASDKGSVNYVLLNANNYFGNDPDGMLNPYLGIGAGMGILIVNGNSTTKFAWDAKAGIKIKTASVVSVKLQAYMQSIVSTFGSDVWIGPGGHAYDVPDYATLWQFGLGGVICFDFKR